MFLVNTLFLAMSLVLTAGFSIIAVVTLFLGIRALWKKTPEAKKTCVQSGKITLYLLLSLIVLSILYGVIIFILTSLGIS